jgi:hypothetical protein
MEIDGMVNRCRFQTWSYTQHSAYTAEALTKMVYDELKRQTSEIEINILTYKETTGKDWGAVYLKFVVQVPYKGRTYPVFAKITFPPNFPIVPPIFSVINSDDSKLQLNKTYINFLLPDKTYEVKLVSSAYWKSSINFKQLWAEFMSCLSSNFPFFQAPNPVRNMNHSVYYDPRYNDVNVTFPFDYNDVVGGTNTSGNRPAYNDRPLNTNFNMNPYAQPMYGNVMNSQGIQQPMVPNPQSAKNPQVVIEAMHKFKSELEIDLRNAGENLEYLLSKQEELSVLENQASEKFKSLDAEIRAINQKNAELIRLQDDSTSGEVTIESIQNLIEFGSPKEKTLVSLATELKGLQETQIFLEDTFFERYDVKYEQIIQKLNSNWRKEFDRKLAQKELSKMI